MAGEMLNRVREVEELAKEKENNAMARGNKMVERAKEEVKAHLDSIMREEEELTKKAMLKASEYRQQQTENALVEADKEIEYLMKLSSENKKKTIDYIVKEVLQSVSA
ncbi:hypothetical protein [Lachnoclostridium sp.]|uniref:hypothetical protein n=1 Tax=Lachnoclostridium sp. TaxID=2028282 RepID=UPI002899067E|nr:hypothetical protein [Lachnoclostridium sp.]